MSDKIATVGDLFEMCAYPSVAPGFAEIDVLSSDVDSDENAGLCLPYDKIKNFELFNDDYFNISGSYTSNQLVKLKDITLQNSRRYYLGCIFFDEDNLDETYDQYYWNGLKNKKLGNVTLPNNIVYYHGNMFLRQYAFNYKNDIDYADCVVSYSEYFINYMSIQRNLIIYEIMELTNDEYNSIDIFYASDNMPYIVYNCGSGNGYKQTNNYFGSSCVTNLYCYLVKWYE